MIKFVNLTDYESAARKKLEQGVFDYYFGGADDEVSLRANRSGWDKYFLRPRMLTDVSKVSAATTVLGSHISMPVMVAPTAGHGMAHPDGECATARGASAAGTGFIVSTSSSCSMEEVANAADGLKWFQLYLRHWQTAEGLLRRAEDAGYSAIVLTVDLPCMGNRERDVRNDIQRREFPLGNYPAGNEPVEDLIWDRLNWDVIEWVRARTTLPLVLKGILTAEDAQLAVEQGVEGIVVSNHGGRQLDGAIPPILALPDIVETVAGRCEVYVDGSVLRGTDVLKALALGARAVLIGRPILWGLAVSGAEGVQDVLEILHTEILRGMKLCGKSTVAAIDASLVRLV